MSVVLSEHLPLLAAAPDGIQKLRGLILELALRGKLVPHDANDEPASELLMRIALERGRLEAEGNCKKSKPMPSLAEDEQPYKIPENWSWCRLGKMVMESGAGWSPSCDLRPRQNDQWGVLKVSAVSWGVFNPNENKALPSSLEPRPEHEVVSGDFLVSRANTAELVARSVVVEECPPRLMLSDKIVRLKLSKLIDARFINLANSCDRARNYYAAVAGGTSTSMKNVSREQILNLVIPLPPLGAQRRIVAKFDELMALCDRLETEHTDAESAHCNLVGAPLGTLIQSADATEFTAQWQRLTEHFNTLFTTESSLNALKQTILQLAVMGKLVPQDSKDEPASELLKRIAQERARLKTEGLYKKSKSAPAVEEDEQPYRLPKGWSWCRFSDVVSIDGSLVDSLDYPEAMQVAPDSIEKGTGRLIVRRTVREAGVRGPNQRFKAGQLLYSKIRPSLSKAVIAEFDGLCSADMYPLDSFIAPKFLLYQILSETFLQQVRVAENRVKMPKLNQESLNSFLVCIPPLAEQHRIVAKVDELVALCDRLKADLAESRSRHERLASTLIETALEAA